MQIHVPQTKAGILSIIVGVGLLITAIGHFLQGNTVAMMADLTGVAGTLGLPAWFAATPPVVIKTPGPVLVEAPRSIVKPMVEVRPRDE